MILVNNKKVGDLGHVDDHNEIARRLQDPRDFGAVGDGIVDCASAFQSALPNIIVPPSGFSFDHSVTPGAFFCMRGGGREGSNLFGRSDLNDALFKLTSGGFHIREVLFVIQNGHPAILGTGVLTDGLLNNCWFTGDNVLGSDALFTAFANNIIICGTTFESASHAIKFIGGSSNYLTISNGCVFYNISNTVLEFNNAHGINISNLFIEEKTIESGAGAAIIFKDCSNINLSNLIFSKVLGAPTASFTHAIRFENCDNVNISNIIADGFYSVALYDIVNSTRINSAVMESLI